MTGVLLIPPTNLSTTRGRVKVQVDQKALRMSIAMISQRINLTPKAQLLEPRTDAGCHRRSRAFMHSSVLCGLGILWSTAQIWSTYSCDTLQNAAKLNFFKEKSDMSYHAVRTSYTMHSESIHRSHLHPMLWLLLMALCSSYLTLAIQTTGQLFLPSSRLPIQGLWFALSMITIKGKPQATELLFQSPLPCSRMRLFHMTKLIY